MPLTLAKFWPVEPSWADRPLAFLERYEPLYLSLFILLIVVFTVLCARRSSDPASTGAKPEPDKAASRIGRH